MERILVTGGCGFIGSNFVRYLLGKYHDYKVFNLDALKYSGNLENLRDVEKNSKYTFIQGDICNSDLVEQIVQKRRIDTIVNFAAETHVDRSIMVAGEFIQTDVYGTYVLLEATKRFELERFVQIGTDEVYGSVQKGSSKEGDNLAPNSPYAASKAAGDLMVRAFCVTYGIAAIITRSSNNFGPYQYPEKLIPLFITNALEDKELPLYGDGLNVRDWIFVLDNCSAIDVVLHNGKEGEIYNIGGGNERTNIEITNRVLDILGKPKSLIKPVKDRAGHDRRYSLDSGKIANELGWSPRTNFDEALELTVKWYADNPDWWKPLKESEREYYKKQYEER